MAGIPDLVRLVADLATYEAAVTAGKTSPDVMYLVLAEKQVYFQGELWSKAPEEGGGVDVSTLATKDELADLTNEIIANEEVVAAAFNDVNERLKEISENAAGDAVTKDEFNQMVGLINESLEAKANADETNEAISGLQTSVNGINNALGNYATTEALTTEITNLTNEIIANEEVHAAALNDLNERLNDMLTRLNTAGL